MEEKPKTLGLLKGGEFVRVRRDLFEVRKRLETELLKCQQEANNESDPLGAFHTKLFTIKTSISITGLPFASYPAFLDEKKRGTLFVEQDLGGHFTYLEIFQHPELGSIHGAIVLELGERGSGNYILHCLLDEVAYYSCIENVDGKEVWSDWRPGPGLQPDPLPGLDRSVRPMDQKEIWADVFGIRVRGFFDRQHDVIVARHGNIPFRFSSRWRNDPSYAGTVGPFEGLEGPQSWRDLPLDNGYWSHLRDVLADQESREVEEKIERDQAQYNREMEHVMKALQIAKTEDHEIEILLDYRKRGEWIDPVTGEAINLFARAFPMHSGYITSIDAMIEQRERAIKGKYVRQQKYMSASVEVEKGDSKTQQNSILTAEKQIDQDTNESVDETQHIGPCSHTVGELARIVGMSESGVCKALRENRKIRGILVKYTRNDGKRASYQIADSSVAKIKRKLSDGMDR